VSETPTRGAWNVFLESWVAPYVRDPTLWPVLIVVVVHVVAFVAPALLLSIRDGGVGSTVTLGIAAAATTVAVFKEYRIRGGPRELTWVLAATWLASAGVAWLAHRYEIF
jgi:hypothetical protein